MLQQTALLWMEHVSKAFPAVQALEDVSLHVQAGEVLGLIGQNGAGKSTLMKILSGVHRVDQGAIYLQGQPIQIQNPHHAQQLGISIIYQELNLIPNLTVMENVFVGREPGTLFVNRRQLQTRTQALLDRLKVDLSPTATVRDLSVAEQQMVEIAKAISLDVRVLIMDEPTSSLSESEVQTLFAVIGELKESGMGIIFISHRLDEVLTICDRVTVLRDGKQVGDLNAKEASHESLIRMMVGRSLQNFYHREEINPSQSAKGKREVVLDMRGITRRGNAQNPATDVLTDVSFQLYRGEILGLAGLVGAGRTELVRTLFGADPLDEGKIYLEAQPVQIHSPSDAIRLGIGLVPEDRKGQGLILNLAVRHNMTLANLDAFTSLGFVRGTDERRRVDEYVKRFQIRTPSIERQVINLSGGNQQKVVIAKWLMLQPKILIMDEPTRGIDVGAKSEIYELMQQLVASGVSIILISSEFPELLAICDRMVCLCEGRVTGVLDRKEASLERLMHDCSLRHPVIL